MRTSALAQVIEILGIWLPVLFLLGFVGLHQSQWQLVLASGFGTGSLIIPTIILMSAIFARYSGRSTAQKVLVSFIAVAIALMTILMHYSLWEDSLKHDNPLKKIVFTIAAYCLAGLIVSIFVIPRRAAGTLFISEDD